MRNLNLQFKFLLIIVLLSLPTAVATTLLSRETTQSIKFTKKEQIGTDLLESVIQLQRAIGQHRFAMVSSRSTESGDVADGRDTLTAALQALQLITQEHSALLSIEKPHIELVRTTGDLLAKKNHLGQSSRL